MHFANLVPDTTRGNLGLLHVRQAGETDATCPRLRQVVPLLGSEANHLMAFVVCLLLPHLSLSFLFPSLSNVAITHPFSLSLSHPASSLSPQNNFNMYDSNRSLDNRGPGVHVYYARCPIDYGLLVPTPLTLIPFRMALLSSYLHRKHILSHDRSPSSACRNHI